MKHKYHIAFDTRSKPNTVRALAIEISEEDFTDDMNTNFSIDLADDPLYPLLEAYVRANPSRNRNDVIH